MLSTAIFEAAQARTFDPRFTSCKIISTTVVVFPVPGGLCNRNRSLEVRAFEMASFLEKRKKKKLQLEDEITIILRVCLELIIRTEVELKFVSAEI